MILFDHHLHALHSGMKPRWEKSWLLVFMAPGILENLLFLTLTLLVSLFFFIYYTKSNLCLV